MIDDVLAQSQGLCPRVVPSVLLRLLIFPLPAVNGVRIRALPKMDSHMIVSHYLLSDDP